jgi:hypothetical protein
MHSASFSREHCPLTEVDEEELLPPQLANAAVRVTNNKRCFFILVQ